MGRGSESLEELVGCLVRREKFRSFLAAEKHGTPSIGADALKAQALRFPVIKISRTHRAEVSLVAAVITLATDAFPQVNEALRLAERQWIQNHCLDHAEDRGCCANAQGQGQDRNRREAGASAQHSQAVANVLP